MSVKKKPTPALRTPTFKELDVALREFHEAVRAEWDVKYYGKQASTLERARIKRRSEGAANALNALRQQARDAFAESRGLRWIPSNHHRDQFVRKDDKRRRPKVVVEVVHGYANDGKRRPIGPNVEPMEWGSWCHGTMPGSWCVIVNHEEKE